jgi:DNA-binding transcriptional regulator YiaG
MQDTAFKEEAKHLIAQMPDDSTWEDLMHEIFVRLTIEAGLAESREGRTQDVEEVRKEFGLSK